MDKEEVLPEFLQRKTEQWRLPNHALKEMQDMKELLLSTTTELLNVVAGVLSDSAPGSSEVE